MFFEQIRRSFAIAKKDLRIYYNKGPVVIQGILFPIMLFLAFTVGRQIIPVYIITGLMSMVLFLTSTSIGPVVFPWETRQKTLERLITCPVSIKTILLGNVWSSFLFGCIFSSVPLVLGLIFYGLWKSINLLIVILGIILAAFSFSSFSLILSVPPTDTPASTMILTILIKFPLIFISPLFMPIMLSPITIISPLTYFLDLLNLGLGEVSAFGVFGLLVDFGFLLLFGFCFLLLAFALHQKTLQKRFKG
ncbi:MAG: ABC transporter permease [Candidatus Lokiarchaeota archaeon]|nr:ABC transporter permease [Candidatus Lokiarchaeota archaeon]MBD3199266.1 ABC transporter permease [Candidatus Lokiarchaeota archaeon]